MGNAITNPGRFLEKKVGHEVFGHKDPRFPQHRANCTRASVVHNTLSTVTHAPGQLPYVPRQNGYNICKRTGHWPSK